MKLEVDVGIVFERYLEGINQSLKNMNLRIIKLEEEVKILNKEASE